MKQLARHYKGLITRGVIAILFGLIAIFMPGLTLQFLVLFFGAYIFLDGALILFVGFKLKSLLLSLEGAIGLLVGAYTFFYTTQAFMIFLLVVGVWAILTGILEVIASFELRRTIRDEIWLFFVGVVSILFGTLVFVRPVIPALALSYLIGVYAIMFGVFLFALGQKLKNYKPSKSSRSKKRK